MWCICVLVVESAYVCVRSIHSTNAMIVRERYEFKLAQLNINFNTTYRKYIFLHEGQYCRENNSFVSNGLAYCSLLLPVCNLKLSVKHLILKLLGLCIVKATNAIICKPFVYKSWCNYVNKWIDLAELFVRGIYRR